MKLLSINAWEGQVKNLKEFILKHSLDTDIFFIQESLDNKSNNFAQKWLPDYQLFFADKRVNKNDRFAQSTLIKKDLEIIKKEIIGVGDNQVGLVLFTQVKTKDNKILNLLNVHGHARPGHKQDTPGRIKQSQMIINFLKDISQPKIIAGDFNLDINIKSVQLFEDNNYRNLIKDHKISTTRNNLSWKKYKNKQLFADFTFISPNLKVKEFTVPNVEVSDHLPMILEFDL